MSFIFKELSSNSKRFFKLLPKEWQAEIVPFWNYYKSTSKVYVIEENKCLIGGGIVFSMCPPDIEYYKIEAQSWFDKGFLYLGFIWIAEDKRNNNLGSFWLNELKRVDPKQKFWLITEEAYLHHFYQKNNFELIKTIIHDEQTEWLYQFNPLSP